MALYSYNNAVPATNNNPSNDQPDMLINTQSIESLIGENHVTFDLANGGQHTSIQFNQDASYVPVPPVSPPELFTNTVNGLPQLFYYSGSSAQSSDQYDDAANLSTFLFGGIILKAGSFSSSAAPSISTIVTYSTLAPALAPFLNNTRVVLLTPINSAAGGTTGRVTATSSTTFTVTHGIVSSAQWYFIAIGD